MKYDFDTPVERRGTDSIKWNVGNDVIPMWVADMDFRTAPEIIRALTGRIEHGVYGYPEIPEDWYEAYRGWWRRRHGFEIEREWLIFCTGVIPAISSTVRKLTTPNENVLIQTPVYNEFSNCTRNNGCRVLENPLIYRDGAYSIDFEDLEAKLADPQTTLMIICNPHNPVGKIWDRETLARIGELAKKYYVTVISDEIHCDITEPGTEYVPFASVSDTCREICVECLAPTKSFNLAGMKSAAVCIPNENLRNKIRRALNTDEVAEPSTLACLAAQTAFDQGEEWLDELREYISRNRRTVSGFLKKELPGVKLVDGEATYLLWLDVSDYGKSSKYLSAYLRGNAGVYVNPGTMYGDCGEGFLRLNIACPESTLLEGLRRLKTGFDSLK